jgi:hypothetical protein
LIARARHAATSFSVQCANSPSGSPSLRTSLSLAISVSRESRPTAPGSRLSEVDHVGAIGGEQHIAGLEVAVHQPGGVDGLQSLGQAGPEGAQRGHGGR